jgi:hypothetical protein
VTLDFGRLDDYHLLIAPDSGGSITKDEDGVIDIGWCDGVLSDGRAYRAEMKVNLPEVVSSTQTNLPLEVIPAGRTIDDGSPDQLALLLAFGVRRDGGRAAILRQNDGAVSVEIFTPREN